MNRTLFVFLSVSLFVCQVCLFVFILFFFITFFRMGLIARKSDLGGSDKASCNPVSSVIETS